MSKTFECTDIYTRHGKGNGLAVYEGEIKNQFYDNFLTENSNIQVTQFFVYLMHICVCLLPLASGCSGHRPCLQSLLPLALSK